MRSLVFVLISIAFGIGAVLLAQNWLKQSQPASPEDNRISVVTMAVSVPSGTILQEKHLVLKTLPLEAVPDSTLTDLEQVAGMVTKFPLIEGDFVSRQKLAKKGEGSVLASLIAPNMRAVSIRVNDVVGVAGFLLPGNRVDVLVTLSARSGSGRDMASSTEVILSNLKVLAVDQKANQDSNQPVLVRAVTLEVTLEQAEVLMSARSRGNIQLALRNPNDNVEVEVASAEPETEAVPEPEPETAAAPVATTPKPAPVSQRKRFEVIKGTQQQTITVGRERSNVPASTTMAQKDG
ncbi:Flp pilus assembly protein CpaB [Ferrimonas balearica]|uniref:Flp pilus assembly protein CpaB n=1 Tax=Ferrimonas balearica TaxID=44012 RepID=UPI001C99795C|nr:Flp pilus assembly protein CpaB [Ferrimonas balearica]MBY5920840.1 Flp pilus assembly protein CpaB [Ferrimonas balearica]MBY5996475.1 Flp pilus assembly protein CpaB [Ferrimonas balearica]